MRYPIAYEVALHTDDTGHAGDLEPVQEPAA
jgi:hypothetical protein